MVPPRQWRSRRPIVGAGGGGLVRVLGVDPGLTRCGIGVLDGGPGIQPTMVEVVVVRTPPNTDISLRLLEVAIRVEELMDRHQPDTVAIERVFSQLNVRTVMGTAQAAGVVALAAARRGQRNHSGRLRGAHHGADIEPVSYTHLRAHETDSYLVCRLL